MVMCFLDVVLQYILSVDILLIYYFQRHLHMRIQDLERGGPTQFLIIYRHIWEWNWSYISFFGCASVCALTDGPHWNGEPPSKLLYFHTIQTPISMLL